MRNSKTNGFTLIELLIVIAIIGILAAVLIPNLLSARQRAFDTAAQSCAKAVATGQEIRIVDGLDYLDIDGATNTVDDLEGTNVCSDDMEYANNSATGQTAYQLQIQHDSGANAYQVDQDGITTLGARF